MPELPGWPTAPARGGCLPAGDAQFILIVAAGRVEIDETYVGGGEAGVAGRQAEQKPILAIAVDINRPKVPGVRVWHEHRCPRPEPRRIACRGCCTVGTQEIEWTVAAKSVTRIRTLSTSPCPSANARLRRVFMTLLTGRLRWLLPLARYETLRYSFFRANFAKDVPGA